MSFSSGIRIVLSIVTNPERAKKILKAVVVVVITAMLLPSIALLGISALFEQGTVDSEYDFVNTEIYEATFPVYKEFMDRQTAEMIEAAERIVEENTILEPYTVTVTDPATGEEHEETHYREVCTVDVYVVTNHMDYSYLLSYFSAADEDVAAGNKYTLKDREIKEFLESIQERKTEQVGSNYFIYNEFFSAEEIAEIVCGDDETQKEFFLSTSRNYQELTREVLESENYHFGASDIEFPENDTEVIPSESGMPIPQMYQYLGAWADYPYGSGTIRTSGCALVALAMVTSYLKDEVITPLDVVEFTGNRYYTPGYGSSWSIFPAVASHYGLNCSNLGKSSAPVIDSLKAGRPVIASMGPGTFTNGGHLIVLKGITEDGKILVNDPNDNSSKNHNQKAFSMNLIMTEGKNFWSFY